MREGAAHPAEKPHRGQCRHLLSNETRKKEKIGAQIKRSKRGTLTQLQKIFKHTNCQGWKRAREQNARKRQAAEQGDGEAVHSEKTKFRANFRTFSRTKIEWDVPLQASQSGELPFLFFTSTAAPLRERKGTSVRAGPLQLDTLLGTETAAEWDTQSLVLIFFVK